MRGSRAVARRRHRGASANRESPRANPRARLRAGRVPPVFKSGHDRASLSVTSGENLTLGTRLGGRLATPSGPKERARMTGMISHLGSSEPAEVAERAGLPEIERW